MCVPYRKGGRKDDDDLLSSIIPPSSLRISFSNERASEIYVCSILLTYIHSVPFLTINILHELYVLVVHMSLSGS